MHTPPPVTFDAVLQAFADLVAERVVARMARPANDNELQPLVELARELNMSPRHVRDICRKHNIPLDGTRNRRLVNPSLVRRALTAKRTLTPVRSHGTGDVSVDELLRRRLG